MGTAEDVQIIARQHHHFTRVDLPGRTILKGEPKGTFRHIMETNDLGRLNHEGPAHLGRDLAANRPWLGEFSVHEDPAGQANEAKYVR